MAGKESPLLTIEPTEKGQRSHNRLAERFKVSSLPSGFEVLKGSECGINDLYMNLNRLMADGKLEEKVKLLVAVGVASSVGGHEATDFFAKAAIETGRTAQETLDAVSVASVCSVFNGYYRFKHQLPESEKAAYEAFKAPFNANTFMRSSLSSLEVEAICIAVSSVNNCELCVEGHLNKGKSLGLTEEQIDEIIKTGAVAGAVAQMTASLGAGSALSAEG